MCVFSPLHAQTHLTQQQMAVCHQSVDSSRTFPWKESQRRETRVQMAVYSATSHPQGVMKEGLSYSRTPSQCLPWNGNVRSRYSESRQLISERRCARGLNEGCLIIIGKPSGFNSSCCIEFAKCVFVCVRGGTSWSGLTTSLKRHLKR